MSVRWSPVRARNSIRWTFFFRRCRYCTLSFYINEKCVASTRENLHTNIFLPVGPKRRSEQANRVRINFWTCSVDRCTTFLFGRYDFFFLLFCFVFFSVFILSDRAEFRFVPVSMPFSHCGWDGWQVHTLMPSSSQSKYLNVYARNAGPEDENRRNRGSAKNTASPLFFFSSVARLADFRLLCVSPCAFFERIHVLHVMLNMIFACCVFFVGWFLCGRNTFQHIIRSCDAHSFLFHTEDIGSCDFRQAKRCHETNAQRASIESNRDRGHIANSFWQFKWWLWQNSWHAHRTNTHTAAPKLTHSAYMSERWEEPFVNYKPMRFYLVMTWPRDVHSESLPPPSFDFLRTFDILPFFCHEK